MTTSFGVRRFIGAFGRAIHRPILACAIALALTAASHAQVSLTEAQGLARDLNPIMKAARADVEAAKAAQGKYLAPYRPMIDLLAYGGRGNGNVMDMNTGLEMLNGSGTGANLALTWKLFSGGQDAAARGIGFAEIAMARARERMAWQDLLLEVREQFAMGLRLQDEVEAVKLSLEAAEELERVTQERVDAGKLPLAFVYGAKSDRLRIERELSRVEAELRGALAKVAACCGADIIGGRLGAWDVQMDVPETLEKAIDAAYANSPDVAELEQEAKAWARRAKQIQGSGLPQVSFFASGDRIDSRGLMDDSGTQVGLFLTFPLFDGGMRKSEAAGAKKKQAEADAKAANKRNRIRAELTAQWAKWLAAPKGIESAKAQIEAAEEGYRIAKLRYEEGKAIRAEVAQALADHQEAHTAIAEAKEYQRTAWSRLVRSMGGPASAPAVPGKRDGDSK